jgi:hypothetical protein
MSDLIGMLKKKEEGTTSGGKGRAAQHDAKKEISLLN